MRLSDHLRIIGDDCSLRDDKGILNTVNKEVCRNLKCISLVKWLKTKLYELKNNNV